jgi:hypothetical protein
MTAYEAPNRSDTGHETDAENGIDRSALVAGVTGLVIIVAFSISNFVLADIPDWPNADASADEIADFFGERSRRLQWESGLRYLEFALVPFFAVGVARHVRGARADTNFLTTVALMSQVWLIATGTGANTFESLLIYRADDLANQPELTQTMFLAMTGLFAVALLPWAVTIFCLSEAGRRTRTLPRPVWIIGYVQAIAGTVAAVAVVQLLEDGPVAAAELVAFLGFALWILLVTVHLLRAARSATTRDP